MIFLSSIAAFIVFTLSSSCAAEKEDISNDSLPISGRTLRLPELSDTYQLLSQYSYGTIGECPDKFKMDISNETIANNNGVFDVAYERIKIELGGLHAARLRTNEYNFEGVICKGPEPNTELTLQAGATVSNFEFNRLHQHSQSTRMLFESLSPRLSSGNYWISNPHVAPFNCSKDDAWADEAWFREDFTFLFFREQDQVPIAFIGKVLSDGSSRLVTFNMTATIRYFIATASQTTCIYRAIKDVERYNSRKNMQKESSDTFEKGPTNQESKDSRNPGVPSKEEIVPAPSLDSSLASGSSSYSPNPSGSCVCPGQKNNINGSFSRWHRQVDIQKDISHPKGRSYAPVPAHHSQWKRDWWKKQKLAPYAPMPSPSSPPGASPTSIKENSSAIPAGSDEWKWFWCSKNREDASAEKGERSCFPGSAIVQLIDGQKVRIDSLRLGDQVLAAGGKYSRVFMFSHSEDDGSFRPFVSLTTVSGRVLTLSPGHYVPVRNNRKFSRADNVSIGDVLTISNGLFDIVTGMSRVRARGLYNPHTYAGTIVVDDMVVSCYTAEIYPAAAHSLLSPLRMFSRLTGAVLSRSVCANGCAELLALWRIFVISFS